MTETDVLPIKPLVCYMCAVRMSSMFVLPAPPGRVAVITEDLSRSEQPVIRTDLNAAVDIIYETPRSWKRVLPTDARTGDTLLPEVRAMEPLVLFPEFLDEETYITSSSSVSHVCCACCGLYQFMDDFIAPVIAASVRVSPFLDSIEIMANISCPRGLTFVWLAAAIFYRRGAVVGGGPTSMPSGGDDAARADGERGAQGAGATQPSPKELIREEFSSFKDFLMGDLRARIMRLVTIPYMSPPKGAQVQDKDAVYVEAVEAALHRRRMEQQQEQENSDTSAPCASNCTGNNGSATSSSTGGGGETTSKGPQKRARDSDYPSLPTLQAFADHRVPRLCSQAFRTCASSSTMTHSATRGGVSINVEVLCPDAYYCLAIPEKITNIANAKIHGKQQPLESIVPPQYCSNKGDSVMTFAVMYDYVLPYLERKHLGPFTPRALGIVAPLVSRVLHDNVFMIGCYRKMLRGLSQSPWFCEGGRVGSYSLQEVIAEPLLRIAFPFGIPKGVLPSNVERRLARTEDYTATLTSVEQEQRNEQQSRKCRGRLANGFASPWQEVDPFETSLEQVTGYGRYKFHSAGREDVDVRMLGTGRPFVLELISPHQQEFSVAELKQLEDTVNESEGGSVEVDHMQYTTTGITVTLARHSEQKTKTYRCVVWSSRKISAGDALMQQVNQMRDVVVNQKTPLRVLHRRSLLDRPRTIHAITCHRVNDHWLMVDLETQAGTYVKEFIHGDNGRTTPNLGILLQSRTDIIQLDVLGMTIPPELGMEQ